MEQQIAQILIAFGINIASSVVWDFIKESLHKNIKIEDISRDLTVLLNNENATQKIIDLLKEKEELNAVKTGVAVVDGVHHAKGKGTVTAIHTTKPTFFKPGTIAIAEGEGEITATRIGGD